MFIIPLTQKNCGEVSELYVLFKTLMWLQMTEKKEATDALMWLIRPYCSRISLAGGWRGKSISNIASSAWFDLRLRCKNKIIFSQISRLKTYQMDTHTRARTRTHALLFVKIAAVNCVHQGATPHHRHPDQPFTSCCCSWALTPGGSSGHSAWIIRAEGHLTRGDHLGSMKGFPLGRLFFTTCLNATMHELPTRVHLEGSLDD